MVEISEVKYRSIVSDFRVIDGDTIELWLDLGFTIKFSLTMRLLGYDAPERSHKDPVHKAAGQVVHDAVTTWMNLAAQYTMYYHSYEFDKYGRVMGDLVSVTFGSLLEYLKGNKMVKAVTSTGKRPDWSQDDLHSIIHNPYRAPAPMNA